VAVAALEVFANDAAAIVSSGGTGAPAQGTVETWTLSGSTLPAVSSSATPPTQCYVADINSGSESEKMLITNISGTTATVTRGADGTTPVTHSAGFTVNQVVTHASLISLQNAAPKLQLTYADDIGADPAGVADSTAAIKAVQTAAGSNPYLIVLGAGTYLLGTSTDLLTFGPNQGIIGQGSALTEINYVGSGTCIAVYESSFNSGSVGAPFGRFSISGYSATGSAKGMSWGNLQAARCDDVTISGFPGDGLYFHNGNATTQWSEQAEWTGIKLVQNATGVVFDTGSFDYSIFQLLIVANSGQNGVTLQNAATLAGERFELRGNFTAGSGNTAWVIGVDPAGGGSGTSSMTAASLYVNVECDGSTGTGHKTIVMDGSSSTQLTGNGTLNFLNGTVSFTGMTPIASLNGIFGFSGTINEPTLGSMVTGDAHAFTGGTNWSEVGSLATAAYNGMDIYPQFGDYQAFLLPNGAITIAAFNGAPYGFARHLTIFFKQPASSSAGTITWTPTITWIGGSALSSTNGVVDRVDLYWLPADSSWLGVITLNAGGGTGTVTSVSVATANGFAGTVATATSTPAITMKTTVTGVLKGNGTAISAAVSGTDYAPATTGSSILKASSGGFTNAVAGTDYVLPSGTVATATAALGIASLTTTVVTSGATAPTISQVLTALSGSAASWQTPSSGFANPMTTLGDMIYENSSPAATRLAGNTTSTKNFLVQTGTGSASNAPAWGTIASIDVPTLNQNTTGTAASFSGSLAGDVTGTQGATSVAKVQGVAITTAEATLVSNLNNATTRSATAALLAGEETIFTGSTASQTLTLPASPTASSINTVTNTASVSVTLAPGAGATLSNFGTSGNIVIPVGYTFTVVYIGTTWYVESAGPSDFAKTNALSIANGGTGQTSAAAAYNALSPMTTTGDIEYESAASTASRLAGNTTTTKKFLTQTGTGSASVAPGWNVIVSGDVPNNAANTSGTATSATNLAGGATLPDYLAPATVALTASGGSIAVNAALGNAFNYTASANNLVSNPTNSVEGQVIRFRITSGGTFLTTWGTNFDFGTGTSPTLSVTSSKVDILAYEYVSSITKWCYLGSGLGY
jgi:hypothetical protein